MRAVVVALGKIGLPIAAQLARTGHEVIGCDVDERVVHLVNEGREPFAGEAGLQAVLSDVVPRGLLRATTDTAAAVATGPDLIIAVPPLVVDADAQPDWSVIDAVVADIARGLAAGTAARGAGATPICVAIETTVPVGTTRTRIAPVLGDDVHVVFSPERVYSGRIFADLATYPKLVGGVTEAAEERGVQLYGAFLPDAEVRAMGGAEAAELTKLVETTYRDVNIALANEFAKHADALGLDVEQVIDAANSQPFSHVHRPGVAVGGHCIPVYPRFYLSGDPGALLPAVARHVNASMPAYAVGLLGDDESGVGHVGAGSRVLILGVTYRGGVKETAFSGAFPLRDALLAQGMHPVAADPLYDADELAALGLEPWDGASPVDAVIVQADHPQYAQLTPDDLPGARIVVDGRGVLSDEPFIAAGVTVRRIGRP
ncbi:MAG: nucleotide sugar dehydrogenase [Solirubrobacterales bacterium]|nr:nucleotide sugar dehydrogenase [Solirubrobacterales bacterium]